MNSNRPSAEAFLSTVKRSGLVEPERLQKSHDEFHASGSNPDDAIALAEFFVAQNLLSKWQAEKLLQGKHKGYFLGKYRLLSLLGKGGMSSVFLAEHILMRRRCAIKVLPTKRVTDSSYLARFHREAQAVAALDHPNIVRAYDVDHQTDRDAEIHFLVMEYVEGESLQEMVANNGPLAFCDAAEYVRQAALGLEHAHQAGMVHRDIKPGNLLVDLNGVVKLLDLGLARYFSSEEEGMALTIAHDEKVLGTADYLAPEQALDSHTVDHRADIYSLGCTLYFLLTGHPPFTEGTLAQRLMAHQTKEPPLVERDRPDTPPSLGALLRKMMSKKADDRQNTAGKVADDMLQWLADNADHAWKQAHSKLFGGLRGSDTNLAQETVAAKAIPVAQPIVLTLTAQTDEADTEIVKRAAWPTGDLAQTTAKGEGESELTAFLAQVDPTPAVQQPAVKTSPAAKSVKTKSATPAAPAARVAAKKSDPAIPNFDFLGNSAPAPAATRTKPIPAAKAAAPAPAKPTSSKIAPKAAPPPAPVPSPPPAAPSAFPDFNFSMDEPAAAPPTPAPPATKPEAPPSAEPPMSLSSIFRQQRPPLPILIAAGVIGLALLGTIGGYFLGWFSGSPEVGVKLPKNTKQSGPWTTRSIQVHGDEADYESLQEALKEAMKHFEPNAVGPDGKPDVLVIHLAEGTYTEQVQIDGSKGKTTWPDGIVVRGEGEVVFTSDKDGPVFSFRNLTGFTLENVTIDAGKKPVGLLLSGFVNDSNLKNLRIRNFTEAGLSLSGVQSFGSQLVVERIRCDSKSESAVGIRVEPYTQDGKSEDSNNVQISRCRLNGPMAAGVDLKGVVLGNVGIRESIFVKTTAGIRFQGPGCWRDFVLTNNTFFQCPTGLLFSTMPDPITSGMAVRRNLFSGCATAEAVVQAGFNDEVFMKMLNGGVDWNMTDRAAPANAAPNEVNLFGGNGKRGVGFAFDSVDPKSPKFLAPSAASLQKTAPNPLTGDQQWVGAVGK